MKNKPSQMELYPIITALFCGCLIISNILASKTFSLYDIILPCGVVIFPLVYIVGDVLTEIYGFTLAKRTIYLGFIINLIAVIAYQIAIFLPGTDLATFNSCHSISDSHILTWNRSCNFKCIQHYFRKHSKDIGCKFNIIPCRILC